jgi:hypothetical protein
VHAGRISEGQFASQRKRQFAVVEGEVRAAFEGQAVDDGVVTYPDCIAGAPKGDRPRRSLVTRRKYPFQEVVEASDTLLVISNRCLIN